jgi:hypothetical protein
MDSGYFIPAAVVATLTLLAKVVPAPKVEPNGPPPTEAERASAKRWELVAVVVWFALAAGLGFAWWGLFRLLAAVALRPGTAAFVLAAEDAALGIPAIFLGIVTAVMAVDRAMRWLLGARYARLDAIWQEKATFDTRKVLAGLYVFVGVLVVAFLMFWLGAITRIGPDGIERGRSFGLRRELVPYTSVRAVQERSSFRAPNGNLIARRHHAILFDDGTEWTSRDALRSPAEGDDEAMRYVAERAGRVMETVP